ncbi:zinc-binding dehydrogenase [Streptomyces catenulae]
MPHDLSGTRSSVLLADRTSRIVERRHPGSGEAGAPDRARAAPGSRYAEEVSAPTRRPRRTNRAAASPSPAPNTSWRRCTPSPATAPRSSTRCTAVRRASPTRPATRRTPAPLLGPFLQRATHVIAPTHEDPVEAIRRITGHGADHSVECIGFGQMVRQALECLASPGVCAPVGLQGPGERPHPRPGPSALRAAARRRHRGRRRSAHLHPAADRAVPRGEVPLRPAGRGLPRRPHQRSRRPRAPRQGDQSRGDVPVSRPGRPHTEKPADPGLPGSAGSPTTVGTTGFEPATP